MPQKLLLVPSQKRIARTLLGFLLSSSIGLLAYRRHSLNRSGVVGTIITGTTTVGLGGWAWGLSPIFFFVTSSLLSHFREHEKAAIAADKFSKGSERDIWQVGANGGVGTLLALVYGLSPSPVVREACEAGYIGAFATANADTWATEIGTLNKQPPRLITTGKTTTPGTSGGITPLGTGVAASGATALGLFYALLRGRHYFSFSLLALTSGLLGSLADSVLGATVQVMYFCPTCGKETERPIHNCGTSTTRLRGISWMNNDAVNFLATFFGACVAMMIKRLIRS